MKFIIKSTATETACELIKYINDALMEEPERVYNIAFCGGLSPALMYDLWANDFVHTTQWNRIHFWFVDEGCFPPESPESNYSGLWNLLLSIAPVPRENVFRIKGENKPKYEAMRYSNLAKKLIPLKNDLPSFDMVLLGIGEDGHVCSIYPNQQKLLSSAEVYEVSSTPQGQKRITLTGLPIINAERVVFIATGTRKAAIVKEIISSADSCPAAYIAHNGKNVVFFMDRYAYE